MNDKEFNLSEKIEVVGFGTDVEFKDKEGNIKIFNATKGEEGIKAKDVKEFIKEEGRLLDAVQRGYISWGEFKYKRDKLAGRKLNGEDGE